MLGAILSAPPPSTSGLGHGPFKAVARVRIPSGALRGQGWSRPGRVGLPLGPGVRPPAAVTFELFEDPRRLGADLLDLLAREAALFDAPFHVFVVLEPPTALAREPDVELEVLRVVAELRALEGLLEVDVPAAELALRARPEDPDGVPVARSLQHHRPMAVPALLSVPRVDPVRRRPVTRREAHRRSLGDVGHEQLGRVLDRDHGELGPDAAVVQHLAAHEDLAGAPATLSQLLDGVSFARPFVLSHSAQ